MAKFAPDAVLDRSLDDIATSNLMILCSAQPTNRTEAVTTYALADVAMSAGDFSIANGASGRVLTIAEKTGVLVDTGGTATHLALVDDTVLKFVTTGSTVLTAGLTTKINSWTVTVPDPT